MIWSADVFHLGPQKTGTTWVYRCFAEHPDIATSPSDAIHYYSMFFHRGNDWYRTQFPADLTRSISFDPTPNYLRSPLTAERIAADNPNAKIIVCLREPIDRAFSHYWHEKKKNRFNFRFEEVLTNFDLFSNWVEPGFYAMHLRKFFQHFPPSQIKIVLFDDLAARPDEYIRDLYQFAGVSTDFHPSVLGSKVNEALPRKGKIRGAIRRLKLDGLFYSREDFESLRDVSPAAITELKAIFEPEISALETLADIDLSSWRERYVQ